MKATKTFPKTVVSAAADMKRISVVKTWRFFHKRKISFTRNERNWPVDFQGGDINTKSKRKEQLDQVKGSF